jgi:hypothetical protein
MVALSGCGNTEAPTPRSPPAESPSGLSVDVVAPVAKQVAGVALMDDYVPAFPHKLRSRKQTDTPEGARHVVVLEYLGVDRDTAVTMLTKSLAGDGYRVHGPLPRTGGVQYAFFGPAGRRMDVIFSDADSRPLVNRDAQGMVMFSWTQPAGP